MVNMTKQSAIKYTRRFLQTYLHIGEIIKMISGIYKVIQCEKKIKLNPSHFFMIEYPFSIRNTSC